MPNPVSTFFARPNNDPTKTIGMAFLVAFVCSVVVSITAVSLKPMQEANRLRESAASMIELVNGLGFDTPTRRFVDRKTGEYVERNDGQKTSVPSEADVAGVGIVDDTLSLYEVREDGELKLAVLPVYGKGYKSMIYGFLALRPDMQTIGGITFYQQDETPGMGARITEEEWQAQWLDKKATDASGTPRISVAKGAGSGAYQVDGISGATRTGVGVSNMMTFWLGEFGFGPYMALHKREADQ